MVRLKSMAKRSKYKPHRARYYAALKRLYHKRYDAGYSGWSQHISDKVLVSSIVVFEWCSQVDILAGNWVLAVLLL